jgi:hypothetical protein
MLLLEAALACDDVDLFRAIHDTIGTSAFLDTFTETLGLCAFFVYSAVSCTSVYLDYCNEDGEREWWEDSREEELFDESRDWYESWSPKDYDHDLAVLYLLHYKGGISASSLLKICIQYGHSAYYTPLCVIGAKFEVDDLYRASPKTRKELTYLLTSGLLDALKQHGCTEDWLELTRLLMTLNDAAPQPPRR